MIISGVGGQNVGQRDRWGGVGWVSARGHAEAPSEVSPGTVVGRPGDSVAGGWAQSPCPHRASVPVEKRVVTNVTQRDFTGAESDS